MATITLRQSNALPHVGATVKGTPLTNDEVDNNFANINISIGSLDDLVTTANANIVVALNEVSARAQDPIPFAIALG